MSSHNQRAGFSRRQLLRGLGLGAATLPLLQAELARSSCLAVAPKRVMLVFWCNGINNQGTWAPVGGGALPSFLASLEPHRSDLIFMRGVTFQNLHDTPNPQKADNAGHGATPAVWTGTRYADLRPFHEEAGGPSVDHHISAEWKKQGKYDRAPLHLGVRHEGYQLSWRGARDAAPPDNDPFHAFDTLFGAATASGQPDPAFEQLRQARKSVLDRVAGDLTRLCQNLGTEDRARCDAHLQSVRELEMQLQATAVGACDKPQLTRNFDPKTDDGTEKTFQAQLDIAVAALASDAARITTITFGNEGNNHIVPTWLGIKPVGDSGGIGDSNSHHSIAHSGDARKLQLDGWHYQQMAKLIERLKSTKEADGTRMLDNTVLVVANCQETGGGHGTAKVPWILAGNSGGYFRTGQVIQADFQHTAVLNAVCEAVGVGIEGYTQPEYRDVLSALKA